MRYINRVHGGIKLVCGDYILKNKVRFPYIRTQYTTVADELIPPALGFVTISRGGLLSFSKTVQVQVEP
jgi:hypothetical protein